VYCHFVIARSGILDPARQIINRSPPHHRWSRYTWTHLYAPASMRIQEQAMPIHDVCTEQTSGNTSASLIVVIIIPPTHRIRTPGSRRCSWGVRCVLSTMGVRMESVYVVAPSLASPYQHPSYTSLGRRCFAGLGVCHLRCVHNLTIAIAQITLIQDPEPVHRSPANA
jgi:hypothetical protein